MGTLIRERREVRGLGVRQLASKARVAHPWLSQVETGYIQQPGSDRLIRVAHALDLDPAEVLRAAGHVEGAVPSVEEREAQLRVWLYDDPRLSSRDRRMILAVYREAVTESGQATGRGARR